MTFAHGAGGNAASWYQQVFEVCEQTDCNNQDAHA